MNSVDYRYSIKSIYLILHFYLRSSHIIHTNCSNKEKKNDQRDSIYLSMMSSSLTSWYTRLSNMISKYHDKFQIFQRWSNYDDTDRIRSCQDSYNRTYLNWYEAEKIHEIKIIKSILVSYDLSIWLRWENDFYKFDRIRLVRDTLLKYRIIFPSLQSWYLRKNLDLILFSSSSR